MVNKAVLLFSLILILLLAACGSNETADTPPAAGDAQPASEADAPVAEPSAEEAAEEVATDTPQPTEPPAPTATPLPTATAEPTATSEPEAQGDGWGESGATAQSACDHPYFPLRTGMTWTMTGADGSAITWEVVEVTGDMQEATAGMVMRSGETELNYAWSCLVDGGLVSFDFANMGLNTIGIATEVTASDGSGYFLPPVDQLEPGYAWDTTYHMEYTMGLDEEGMEDMTVDMAMDMDQTSTILNDDAVEFAGEIVPGLLIEQLSEMLMTMSVAGSPVENTINTSGELQLGRGLGIIRQTSSTEFGDFTMEATEIYVP